MLKLLQIVRLALKGGGNFPSKSGGNRSQKGGRKGMKVRTRGV